MGKFDLTDKKPSVIKKEVERDHRLYRFEFGFLTKHESLLNRIITNSLFVSFLGIVVWSILFILFVFPEYTYDNQKSESYFVQLLTFTLDRDFTFTFFFFASLGFGNAFLRRKSNAAKIQNEF